MKVKATIFESKNTFVLMPENEFEKMLIEALERDLKDLETSVSAFTNSTYGIKKEHNLSITLTKVKPEYEAAQYRNA